MSFGDRKPVDLSPYAEPLRELSRLLRLSAGEFSLILAVCHSTDLREALIGELRQNGVAFQEIVFPVSANSLLDHLVSQTAESKPEALMVTGLDQHLALEDILIPANLVREEFRQLSFPLVLWLSDMGLEQMIRSASDLYSWANTVSFPLPLSTLVESMDDMAEQWIQHDLNGESADTTLKFMTNNESILMDLEGRRSQLSSEQAATLSYLQGCWAFENGERDIAKEQFNKAIDTGGETQSMEKVGLLYARLARCEADSTLYWWNNRWDWDAAQTLMQKSIQQFEQGERLDLAGRFMGELCEYFQQRSDWDGLNITARRALELHQMVTAPNSKRFTIDLAQDYGYLAKAAFEKGKLAEAIPYAKQALQVLEDAQIQHIPRQARYRLILARALEGKGKIKDAIAALGENPESDPRRDPLLHIQCCEMLGKLFRAEGEYLKAFRLEQQKRYVQYQYRFLPFTGRLRYAIEHPEAFSAPAPKVTESQPIFEPIPQENRSYTEISNRITGAGRQIDVRQVSTLFLRSDIQLMVLHGQSGVGKSSLIQSGLVAELREMRPEGARVIPVLVHRYTNWVSSVALGLEAEVTQRQDASSDQSPQSLRSPLGPPNLEGAESPSPQILEASETQSPPILGDLGGECNSLDTSPQSSQSRQLHGIQDVEQLTQRLEDLGKKNCCVVLVFDQFEEFFFGTTLAERLEFWKFLQQCLNQSSLRHIKVMLSLREDYLHYLLESERVDSLDGTSSDALQNILSPRHRYYLGNFSIQRSKEVLAELTQESQFQLAPDLMDQLAKDLAIEGEVRPIEIQIIGTQLQEENIQTREAYQAQGDKNDLVDRYIKSMVSDCGNEKDQKLTDRVLYILTDERGTRPMLTKQEIEQAIESLAGQKIERENRLDTILQILVEAGLVVEIQDSDHPQFQLFHDYIATFIRRTQRPMMVQLEEERKKRSDAEKKQLKGARRAAIGLAGLAMLAIVAGVYAFTQQQEANTQKAEAIKGEQDAQFRAESYSMLDLQNAGLEKDAVTQMVRTGQRINSQMNSLGGDTQYQTTSAMREVMFATQEQGQLLGHSNFVWSVAFSPDGETIGSASGDNTVKLWSIDGKELRTLKGHSDEVYSVAFSPDGKTIASASGDNTVKLWSTDGKELRTLKGHSDEVSGVAFSPDGKTIASASVDNTVKLWSTDGKELRTIKGHSAPVNIVTFSPDGKTIASASSDNTVKLWSTDGKELRTLKGHSDYVHSVAFSPDGETIASASGDNTVKLWSTDGKELRTLKGHSAHVFSVAFSPDGEAIASAGLDNTVKLWSTDGKELRTLKGHKASISSVAFSPDSKTIASASADQSVKLWSTDGKELRTLNGHSEPISSVAFSPDGKTIASASADQSVKLWSTDGKELRTLKGHRAPISSVAFSSDGKTIASASEDKTVKLWSTDGKELRTLKGHSNSVFGVAFSPDGKTIASASADQSVKFWNTDGKELKTLKGHSEPISSLIFSPDGKTIASASRDNTVKLWSTDGRELRTLKGHSAEVYSVAFSPDGETIASASEDQSVILWNLNPKQLVKQGCNWLEDYLIRDPDILEELIACQELNPTLTKQAIPALLAQAETDAKQGQVEKAIESFHQAKDWGADIDFDPATRARELAQSEK